MTGNLLVFLGAALASAVEMVEALTIVLALGVTRGWRAPLQGAVAALVVLAVLVAALGPALEAIPIDVLRLIVGSLLLVFGLQWLRKAILRASGLKALHDEDAAFAAEVAAAQATGITRGPRSLQPRIVVQVDAARGPRGGVHRDHARREPGRDRGRRRRERSSLSSPSWSSASLVRHPLSRVPENTLKFTVGVMLTSFGTFWAGEGVGIDWPGDEASLAALIVSRCLVAPFARLLGRTPKVVTA